MKPNGNNNKELKSIKQLNNREKAIKPEVNCLKRSIKFIKPLATLIKAKRGKI